MQDSQASGRYRPRITALGVPRWRDARTGRLSWREPLVSWHELPGWMSCMNVSASGSGELSRCNAPPSLRQHMLTQRSCQHMLTPVEATLQIAEGAASNDPDAGLRAV